MSWEQKWDLMLARIKKMTDDANRWADYSEKHTRRLGDQQETEDELRSERSEAQS